MGAAFGWGLLAGSSLILGGVLALVLPIRERLLGLIMGFGAGVLISAVAYELVQEAFETSGGTAGSRSGSSSAPLRSSSVTWPSTAWAARVAIRGAAGGGSALAIVLGIVLDGIPESAVIGLRTARGCRSSPCSQRCSSRISPRRSQPPPDWWPVAGSAAGSSAFGCWSPSSAASASLLGYAVFDSAGPGALAFVLAFAGGAILTMLADTMMPEAFEHGGKLVGLVTTLGFALAFALSMLE